MIITVVGGGNIGTQFAVHCAEKGHSVRIFTSSPEHFAKRLNIVDKSGSTIHEGDIDFATNDPGKAFRDADVIMITMPPPMMIPLAQLIYEYADERPIIGFVPGNGGFELALRDCIERGNAVFGIDRVPAIARLTRRGQTVCCSGYKEKLYVGALPADRTEECASLIEGIYDIPCIRLPGFMALTLTPSNPILHTSRLKTIFSEYEPGVTYTSLPLFYEDWDDASSELLMACDDEIQEICRAMPEFGLEYVVSEREFYNADTTEEMTRAIRTEESLAGLTTPAVRADCHMTEARGKSGIRTRRKQIRERIENHILRRQEWRERLEQRRSRFYGDTGRTGVTDSIVSVVDRARERKSLSTDAPELIPDLHSRYFTADFPYGLFVIQQIGHIAEVSIPNIDMLIEWYDGIGIINDKLYLQDYGISDMQDLKAFYLPLSQPSARDEGVCKAVGDENKNEENMRR